MSATAETMQLDTLQAEAGGNAEVNLDVILDVPVAWADLDRSTAHVRDVLRPIE